MLYCFRCKYIYLSICNIENVYIRLKIRYFLLINVSTLSYFGSLKIRVIDDGDNLITISPAVSTTQFCRHKYNDK